MKKLLLTLTLLSIIATTQATPKVEQNFLDAVAQGNIKKATVALNYGADTTYSEYGDTLLHVAAKQNQVEIASLLLASGADVNATNKLGQTPLHYASKWTPTTSKLVQLLLEHNASVKAEDWQGRTPLMVACGKDIEHSDFIKIDEATRTSIHVEIINLLLQAGASANEKSTENGLTPLHHLFTDCGDYNHTGSRETIGSYIGQAFEEADRRVLKVAQLLIDNGADVNAQDNNGHTPLLIASYLGDESIVDLLLSKGAHVNTKDYKGETALYTASEHGKEIVVEKLLKKKADLTVRVKGFTPLHVAVENKELAVVQVLVEYGASIDAQESQGGNSPLMLACSEGYTKIAEFLLNNGAKVNIKEKAEPTATYIALQLDHTDSSALTPLCVASAANKKKIIELLIDHGAQVNDTYSEYQVNPLHIASIFGNVKAAKALITKGANIQAKTTDGDTALHHAAEIGSYELAELLLTNKALIDVKNSKGNTPLIIAVIKGHYNIVELLLKRNAQIDLRNSELATPLSTAVEEGHYNITKLLLEHGANPTASIKNRRHTALTIAKKEGHTAIIKLLEEHTPKK